MESTQAASRRGLRLERVLGIILLIPPLIGVLLFVLYLIIPGTVKIFQTQMLVDALTSQFWNGGYTQTAPIFLGLMAIAGAILLKGTDKP